MHLIDYIIIAVIATLVIFAVRSIIKRKGKCDGCSGCDMCGSCGQSGKDCPKSKKSSKKIKFIVILFASIVILYSILLIYKPIYVPFSTEQEQLGIKITQGIFTYYKIDVLHQYGVADYRIRSADLKTTQDNRNYVFVQYDIKPTKLSYNNWNAGNGETGKDGWLLNKSTFFI